MDFLVDFTAKVLKKYDRWRGKEEAEFDAERYDLPTLGERGFKRRDGGYTAVTEPLVEFSASSQQVAGLFPFSVGSSTPFVGTILGKNLLNQQPVTGDPISWYLAGLISAPSGVLMALNGRGKSSLVQRMMLGCADSGFIPMVLGDTKPDYAETVKALGGVHVRLGPDLDCVNPLDAGPLWQRIGEIEAYDAQHGTNHAQGLRAEMHTRRVSTLLAMFRLSGEEKAQAVAHDSLLLSLGVQDATERCEAMSPPRQPLIADVQDSIARGGERFRTALLVDTEEEYIKESRALLLALNVFSAGGVYGNMFSQQTSKHLDLTRPVDFDISAVRVLGNKNLLATVQIVCWYYGQAAMSAAKTLAHIGLMPELHYFVVLDEMWQLLELDPEMIGFIDEYTRLNRTIGIAQMAVTHTPKDLVFADSRLTEKAKGFLERSPFKLYGALSRTDMPALDEVIPMSEKEKKQLVDWSPDGVMDPNTHKITPPVGLGKFLFKAGPGPGRPFQVTLTAQEKKLLESNKAWSQAIEAMGSRR